MMWRLETTPEYSYSIPHKIEDYHHMCAPFRCGTNYRTTRDGGHIALTCIFLLFSGVLHCKVHCNTPLLMHNTAIVVFLQILNYTKLALTGYPCVRA
jgi:hypothetical protein